MSLTVTVPLLIVPDVVPPCELSLKSCEGVRLSSAPVFLLRSTTFAMPSPSTSGLTTLKVALMVIFAVIVTVQGPVPVHPPPLHPVKLEPPVVLPLSVTEVPLGKEAVHTDPQVMPPGLLFTVPLPSATPLNDQGICTGRCCWRSCDC